MNRLFAAGLLISVLTAVPLAEAPAEEAVSPSEFQQYAEGWTLYFERDGQDYGSETFEPEGKVRWRYKDGSCVDGTWRPHGAQLCFLYDSQGPDGEILCWRVLRMDDGGLIARLLNRAEDELELRITKRDKKPLLCGTPGTET